MNMFVYERRATGGPVCPLCLSMCFIRLLLPACFLDRYFDLFIVKPYLSYFFLLINMFVYERRATGGLVCPHPLSLQSGTWKIKLIPFNRDSLLLWVGFDREKNGIVHPRVTRLQYVLTQLSRSPDAFHFSIAFLMPSWIDIGFILFQNLQAGTQTTVQPGR